ncbi:MAG TPA: hypothetical protein VHR39_00060 [Propionibacteriaceae bacterium]|jgi:hypothetical protein|nr:hypothetical protein [Propionibacteriaceae bacterium]
MADVIQEGVRPGILRGIGYGLFGKPDTFMPQLHELGAIEFRDGRLRLEVSLSPLL